MRLTKGLKSILGCLVIVSVAVFMCQGIVWAESVADTLIKAARSNRTLRNTVAPTPAKGILSAVVAGTQGSTVPAAQTTGVIAYLAPVVAATHTVPAAQTTGVGVGQAAVVNKAPALPNPTPTASVVKAPRVPLVTGQTGKIQLNSPLTSKGVKKFK